MTSQPKKLVVVFIGCHVNLFAQLKNLNNMIAKLCTFKMAEKNCKLPQPHFQKAVSGVCSTFRVQLYPQQEKALSEFLSRSNVHILEVNLPTGYWKSLIYQMAPLVAKVHLEFLFNLWSVLLDVQSFTEKPVFGCVFADIHYESLFQENPMKMPWKTDECIFNGHENRAFRFHGIYFTPWNFEGWFSWAMKSLQKHWKWFS